MLLDKRVERELLSDRAREERVERLTQLEDRVYLRATDILESAMGFEEIEEHAAEPPAHWVEQLGQEGAERKLRLAKRMWEPGNMAPAGVALAQKIHSGISKARGMNKVKLTQNNLNVKIELPAPTSREHPGPDVYEVKELDADG